MGFQRVTLESRARESNISESDLYDYIDMMKTKVRDRSSSSDSVESLTWEHFFPGECFPGNEAEAERTVFKMELEDAENHQPSRLDRIFSDGLDYSIARPGMGDRGKNRWIHDKYSSTPSSPTKHVPPPSESEQVKLPDYYKPSGSLLRSDYYRPARDGVAKVQTRENVPLSVGHSPTSPSKGIPTGPKQDQSRSRDEELRNVATRNGITTQRFDMVQRICNEEVHTKHSNKVLNPEWLKWREQSMMWSYFSFQKPFPFQEPHWAPPSKGASTPSGSLEPLKTLSNGVTDEIDKRGTPGPKEYFTLEKQMEDKVKQRGGHDLRRQFFQYLQRMRDQANSQHKHCEKAVKHFMADRLTWKRFFKDPFPGKEPIGGHTRECINRPAMADNISTRSKQPLPTSETKPVPVVRLPPSVPLVQIPRQVQAQAQMPAKKPELEIPTRPQTFENPRSVAGKESEPMHDTVLQVNGRPIICSTSDIKNIAYSIMKDAKFQMVAKAFKCKFQVSHIGKSGTLMLASIPLEEGIFGWPDQFLLQWATKVLEGDPVEMSSYFQDYCQTNGAPKELVEGIALQYDEIARIDSLGGRTQLNSFNGPVFECADQQWEQYAEAFAACDIDRIMMEECAKAEGLLRMVHDEESGELISLEEFKKRTMCRFVGLEGRDPESLAEAAPTSLSHAAKRKSDEDDDQTERKEKRVKVEVDVECLEEGRML